MVGLLVQDYGRSHAPEWTHKHSRSGLLHPGKGRNTFWLVQDQGQGGGGTDLHAFEMGLLHGLRDALR